jgi:hypothetical protein
LLLIVLAVVGLVELIRTGDTMETWQVVVWAVLIVLAPVIGLVVFLFWRLSRSEAMQDAIDFHEQQPGMGRRKTTPPSLYTERGLVPAARPPSA